MGCGMQGVVDGKNLIRTYQKDYWDGDKIFKRRLPAHPCVYGFVKPKLEMLYSQMPFTPSTTLLDVGAGNGHFGYYLQKACDVTCVDYSQKLCWMNPVIKTFVMEAENLKFNDSSFDIVFCAGVLHHVESESVVIKEMARVSKEWVVLLEPNRNNPIVFLFSLFEQKDRKALRYTKAYLSKLCENAGLKAIKTFSMGFVFPNKMPLWLVRFLNKFDDKRSILGTTNFIICKKVR